MQLASTDATLLEQEDSLKQDDLLDALYRRVPFRSARRLLLDAGYPSGHGWDAVFAKLKDPDVAGKGNLGKLLSLYTQALAASEKRLSVYEIGRSQLDSLDQKLAAKLKADASLKIASSYPLPLSASDLTKVPTDPVVAGKVAYSHGSIFVISYVKETRFRVAISPSQVSNIGKLNLQEVYGIGVERSQAFDAVIIPGSGDRLVICTDVLENKSQESSRGAASRVNTFLKLVSGVDLKPARVNLFPAISKFYNDSAVDITYLDHVASDGQAISEKTKGGQTCIRTADFHQGGMSAVPGGTDAFGVTVAWSLASVGNTTARIELDLTGTTSLAYDLNPTIEVGYLSKAATVNELHTVLQSLLLKI